LWITCNSQLHDLLQCQLCGVDCWSIGGYGYWCLHHVRYNASNTTFVQNLNKFLSNQVQQVGMLCHTYYYEPHKTHLGVSFRFNLGDHNTSYSSLCHNICEDFASFVHLSKLAQSFQETQLCGWRDVHYVTNQDKCVLALYFDSC
jgi:hypothetical protein